MLSNTSHRHVAYRLLKVSLALGLCLGALFPLGSNAQQCLTPPSGLVSWWPGDGNTNDIRAGNNGAAQRDLTYAPGKVGQAFSFNGAFAHLQVPMNIKYFQPRNKPFTLDFWIKSEPIPSGAFSVLLNQRINTDYTAPILLFIDNRGNSSPYYPMFGYGLNNALVFSVGNGNAGATQVGNGVVAAAADNAIKPGQWQLITVVRRINPSGNNKDRMDIYIDGQVKVSLDYNQNFLGDLNPVAPDMFIGTYQDNGAPTAPVSNAFKGLMDEIEIFDRDLSDAEVLSIYNADTAGKCKNQLPPVGMVPIPAGDFQMGDSFNEGNSSERPVHTVTVSAFTMDKFEVTKALWDEVANWAAGHGYDIKPGDGGGKAADHPVQSVSWYGAVKWANARSEKEGLTPAYYTDGTQATVYRTGSVNVPTEGVKWTANGYRLPTEAEWEKAARGGVAGHRFPWSDADTIQHARANYHSCPSPQCSASYSYDTSPTRGYHPTYATGGFPYTSPVGSFAPNGYGLYDMAGNVWEWAWDWYDSGYYSRSAGSDPRGPVSGSCRVLRGGSWYILRVLLPRRLRYDFTPDYRYFNFGFRVVRPLG